MNKKPTKAPPLKFFFTCIPLFSIYIEEIKYFIRFINIYSPSYSFGTGGMYMTGFLITLVPASLLCGGVAMLIHTFVKKDSYHYDQENLWEDTSLTSEDYRLK